MRKILLCTCPQGWSSIPHFSCGVNAVVWFQWRHWRACSFALSGWQRTLGISGCLFYLFFYCESWCILMLVAPWLVYQAFIPIFAIQWSSLASWAKWCHVLPPQDSVLDQRWADLVFCRAGVHALGDAVVADPIGRNDVVLVAHIPGHDATKAAPLKEDTYVHY